jgi:hypothetical protein
VALTASRPAPIDPDAIGARVTGPIDNLFRRNQNVAPASA